ncbi:MAG: hypothetical protein H0W36_06520, partial [Gemmatimonadetes bacterium]|nr:hypothetical protein [Gemmatimonadota bacterium]
MQRFHIAILAIAMTLLVAPQARGQERAAPDTTASLEEIEARLLEELGAVDSATADSVPGRLTPDQGA